ncbi:hypothetical protein HGRIS_013828 [Hohenbuehelia grisea]|uniref:alpha-1,2-Mannosidase n=1 Tax=Hohenbuehelia grisea TaxID=104357 RepID=A0ABR3IWT8_9AGAR
MLPTHSAIGENRFRARGVFGRSQARWLVLGVTFIFGVWLFGGPKIFNGYDFRLPSSNVVLADSQEQPSPQSSRHASLPSLPSPSSSTFSSDAPSPTQTQGPVLDNSTKWDYRALRVRNAYLHAYTLYKKHAAGYDELLPISLGHKNNFNGWGVSMIDSLDTMWIMGLHDEFNKSLEAVSKLTFSVPKVHFLPRISHTMSQTSQGQYAPFFETVIRYLGGLLSAYALSGQTMLLSRAEELGRKLLPVFESSHGLPWYSVNTDSGEAGVGWLGGSVLFAEAMSCQMEYKYLAHLTGRSEFYDKVEKVMRLMYRYNPIDGLFPERWSIHSATPKGEHFTVGSAGDSGYEYLLKQYLLSGKSEPKARDQYIKSANGIINKLLYLSPLRDLLYVTDTDYGDPSFKLEHLSCFLPGLLALGVHTLGNALSLREQQLHKWAAEGLAHTCWITYADSASGLGPDVVRFGADSTRWIMQLEAWEKQGRPGRTPPGLRQPPPVKEGNREYRTRSKVHMLRPEKTTGDTKWRERGWTVFEALEKHSRHEHGFATVHDVDAIPVKLDDDMPSFFLAETLKYLYLLFSDREIIPLDKWVFNTEAHPLPVFLWTDWEKAAYNIP